MLGTGGEGEVALTAFEQMATSAEAKVLGPLAEGALARGPLGPMFENGVLTETIDETNAFGGEAWDGWTNLAQFGQRVASHEMTPVVVANPQIGYTELYGLNPRSTRSPARCSSSAAGQAWWAG